MLFLLREGEVRTSNESELLTDYLDDVQLGNSLYLIDERMSINELARIVEIERFPYDNTRSPIVTISTVKRNSTDAVVQQKVEQKKLERTAMKQKVIYNVCTITSEDTLAINELLRKIC